MLVYANLKTSIGALVGAPIKTLDTDAQSSTIEVTWDDNSGQGSAQATDTVYAVVINEVTGNVDTFSGSVVRSVGIASIESSEGFSAGNTLHVYLSFRRADGTLVSDSSYSSVIAQ